MEQDRTGKHPFKKAGEGWKDKTSTILLWLMNPFMSKKQKTQRKIQIGIVGPEEKNLPGNEQKKKEMLRVAKVVGRLIAKNGAILITGGCSGVVEASCKAAYEAGGIVVGTPGRKRGTAIPWVTVEICTPIDIGDFIFAGVLSCDAIIVLPGDAGTLAELAIAYRYKKPLIFIKELGENLLNELKLKRRKRYPYFVVDSAEEAANLALEIGKS